MNTCMDVPSMKKLLEFELSLDERNLCSHAWYHGAITRYNAEEIVDTDGTFLIRDCTSQPGNYVLTCRMNLLPLHFVINKYTIQQNTVYEHVQYHFEDDYFDTIPDLVTSYVASGKPITQLSGAIIQYPVNRLYPLSYYSNKSNLYSSCHCQSPSPTTPLASLGNRSYTGNPNPSYTSRCSHDALKQHTLAALEANCLSQHEKCNSADGEIKSRLTLKPSEATANSNSKKYFSQSLPRKHGARLSESPSSITLGRSPVIDRAFSNHSLCEENLRHGTTSSSKLSIAASESQSCREEIFPYNQSNKIDPAFQYNASASSDSGNGSGDSTLNASICGEPCSMEIHRLPSGVIIRNPRYNSSSAVESHNNAHNGFDRFDFDKAEQELLSRTDDVITGPEVSCFCDLENYQTLLLPSNGNKPLDIQALQGLKMMIKEYGSRTLANHLTKCDFDIIYGRYSYKNICGIEMCALPLGHQFRLDVIERTECLKLLVAVSILTCDIEDERVDILKMWIEVAIDTKTALGNLYGFCGIMMGLSLPQMQKIGSTWHCLRQRYTDQAFMFEAKLRPMLKSMHNCSSSQAPNTSIPHLMPFVLLMESTSYCDSPSSDPAKGSIDHHVQDTNDSCPCLSNWVYQKLASEEIGLPTLYNHLDHIRKCLKNYTTIHRNAEIVLEGVRIEEMVADIFRTEFQKKFLWGSAGATASFEERHSNMNQILTVLAEHYAKD